MPREAGDRMGPAEERDPGDDPCVLWSGGSRKVPVVLFHAEAIITKEAALRAAGERYRLTYKMVRTDSRLVRSILSAHGFQEVNANSNDFNLMWTGSHIKPHVMRSLAPFQRVNHFPRSYELTRKDRLYKNVQRMQQTHGARNFNLLPPTYLLPAEHQDFCNAFSKDRGPWIVKPVASSRGRGVYLINSPSQIAVEENILVSRYISNPLLIDGFKFDVRLYVLVTSYDPLVIYLYEEGLTRFATVRYDRTSRNIKNQFMHLTNYSVNKRSGDYVSCDDPEVEDYGNKWSMSAMLRFLKQEGKDTAALMSQVEDLVIKAVISGELPIAAACRSFLSHRGSCFELYGFDVLIDGNLRPWLLEVNLSPSLACDAPLDVKVKASMISDMLTLVGVECQDPQQRPGCVYDRRGQRLQRQRPLSASDIDVRTQGGSREKSARRTLGTLGLSVEEVKVLRRVQEEEARRGSFVRIFPRPDTWSLYGSFLEHKTSLNHMLATQLFPDRAAIDLPKLHAALYERKLVALQLRRARRRRTLHTATASPDGGSEHDQEEEEEEEEEEEKEEEPKPETSSPDTAPPPLPRPSIMEMLHNGSHLSKVQARCAFSTYLQRVQSRLQTPRHTHTLLHQEEEHMALVLRFLQRAAGNLQQPLGVTVPRPSLPLPERRHLLANQLRDFLLLYNQETGQMCGERQEGATEVTAADFQAFIDCASEGELEDVLTWYTHRNHSASVFLGSAGRRQQPPGPPGGGATGPAPPRTAPAQGTRPAREMAPEPAAPDPPESPAPEPPPRQRSASPSSWAGSRLQPAPGVAPLHRSQSLAAVSSFQSAAQIYSQRLSRPRSTRAASAQPSALRSRCGSASAQREELYQVGAVTASLQRLAEKQAARQHAGHLTQQLALINLASGAFARAGTRPGSAQRPRDLPQRVAWDSAPSAAHSQSETSNEVSGNIVLHPTPPPATKMCVARKMSAARAVRVAASGGPPLAGDTGAPLLGVPDATQVIFARARPPAPPPRTSSKVQRRRDVAVRPT